MPSDHFGPVADAYAAFRPHYPESLFDALMDWVPSQQLAWDAGCGTGQASLSLAHRFLAVHATDASASQIERATPHERISYSVTPAHESGLPDGSVDLITVAQALHWFDVNAFHAEATRVLAPNGVIAEWSYGLLDVPSCAPIAAAVNALDARLREWWPPERAHVDNGYRDLPFPFTPIDIGAQVMHADWSRDQLLGYLGTWSAVTRYRSAHADESSIDPLQEVAAAIDAHWGTTERRQIDWPLSVRVGTPGTRQG